MSFTKNFTEPFSMPKRLIKPQPMFDANLPPSSILDPMLMLKRNSSKPCNLPKSLLRSFWVLLKSSLTLELTLLPYDFQIPCEQYTWFSTFQC